MTLENNLSYKTMQKAVPAPDATAPQTLSLHIHQAIRREGNGRRKKEPDEIFLRCLEKKNIFVSWIFGSQNNTTK